MKLNNRFTDLDTGDRVPENLWTNIKTIISEEAEKNITDEGKKPRSHLVFQRKLEKNKEDKPEFLAIE